MLRKLLAVLLILILVLPLLHAALTLFAVSGWALKRSFYRELLGQEAAYAALLREARANKDRAWDLGEWVPPPGLEGPPVEALAKALAQTVSADYLRGQAVQALEVFFDAMEGTGGGQEPAPALDLRPLKRELGAGSRQAFANALAEALPSCRSGQDPLNPVSRLPACRPSGMSVQRASQLVQAALPAALQRLPDRYPISDWAYAASWIGPLSGVRLGWAAVVLGLIAAGVWIGAAFLGGRNRAQVTAFLGWSLLPPALLTLASGLALRFAFLGRWLWPLRFWTRGSIGSSPWPAPGSAAGASPWASSELALALLDALRVPLLPVSRGFLIAGGVALGLSLGLIVWWRTIRPEP